MEHGHPDSCAAASDARRSVCRSRTRPDSRRRRARPSRPRRRHEIDLHVRRAARRAPARSRSARSVRRRGITTSVSGSPNRQLYSSTFGPSGVSISPAYRSPRYGTPSCGHGVHRAAADVPDRVLGRRRHPRERRVRAHPAGVRSGVAVADALEVLGQSASGTTVLPSDSANAVTSGPLRISSTTTVAPASPNVAAPGGSRRARPPRSARPVATVTPFPRGEPVGLHDRAPAERVDEGHGRSDLGERPGSPRSGCRGAP